MYQNCFTTDQVLQMFVGIQGLHHPGCSSQGSSLSDSVIDRMMEYLIQQFYISANVDINVLEARVNLLAEGKYSHLKGAFQKNVVSDRKEKYHSRKTNPFRKDDSYSEDESRRVPQSWYQQKPDRSISL